MYPLKKDSLTLGMRILHRSGWVVEVEVERRTRLGRVSRDRVAVIAEGTRLVTGVAYPRLRLAMLLHSLAYHPYPDAVPRSHSFLR